MPNGRPCWLCLMPALGLQACAEPSFEFRGYSDLSSCGEIIDAELANGGTFQGGYASEDLENPGYVTELSGELFAEPVRIDVLCNIQGFISSIHYISRATDPMETGPIFRRFGDELAMQFGEPTVIVTEQGRSLRYVCQNPSPVLLDEWRLESEGDDEDQEPVHEVYLAVMPRNTECLTDR